MDLPVLAFSILGLFIICIFAYQMWSKKGRRQTIEMITGLKVVGEVAELPSNEFSPRFGLRVHQDLRLYKCKEGDNLVYILENTQRALGGISRNFIKLSSESIDRINQFKNRA
ncbi:MAG: hypothetical protein WAV41_00670 [Microgenomates group bacterium]